MRVKIALAAVAACLGAAASASAAPIAWHGCPEDLPPALQCGEIKVPLDYAHPGGEKIAVGFARLPASDRRHRIGSLIVNPGGPGGAGSFAIASDASGQATWHPRLHQRFDLIGLDPRGISPLSAPVLCDPATLNAEAPLFPRSAAEFGQLQSWAEGIGRGCLEHTGELLRHVDSASVARDMEALRRALGDGKLNFLGVSYGAEMGTLYA